MLPNPPSKTYHKGKVSAREFALFVKSNLTFLEQNNRVFSFHPFLNVLFPLCFKVIVDVVLVDPSHLAFDLIVSVGWEDHSQRGVFQELLGFPACTNSDGAGSF